MNLKTIIIIIIIIIILKNYKNKGYLPSGYDKILDLQAKIKDYENRNAELTKELKSMHKIQVE